MNESNIPTIQTKRLSKNSLLIALTLSLLTSTGRADALPTKDKQKHLISLVCRSWACIPRFRHSIRQRNLQSPIFFGLAGASIGTQANKDISSRSSMNASLYYGASLVDTGSNHLGTATSNISRTRL